MKIPINKKEYNIYRSVSSSRLNKSVGVDGANFSCKIVVIEDIYIKLNN
jgi:hypothetical protein